MAGDCTAFFACGVVDVVAIVFFGVGMDFGVDPVGCFIAFCCAFDWAEEVRVAVLAEEAAPVVLVAITLLLTSSSSSSSMFQKLGSGSNPSQLK